MLLRLLTAVALLAGIVTIASAQSQENQDTESVILAGGCFWCMEPPYDKTEGILSTTSGYSGGEKKYPTYNQVASGQTEHIEVVKIEYDPSKIGFEELLEIFWVNIDPLDGSGQFCDKGPQYRPAIFYGNEEEKKIAQASKQRIAERFDQEIKTEILPESEFWEAEAYHQNYYKKNPVRYKFYRWGCGRDARLAELWGEQKQAEK